MTWTDKAGLEYYSPNPQFGCYSEPVFAPGDILMQAAGLPAMTGYNINIFVCDLAGNIIEDATANFDNFLSSFIISGTTYYYLNLRCDHFSPAMISNGCFTLEVIISDSSTGTTVFDQFTQKFQLVGAAASGLIFASGVSIDGATSVNCIPGANAASCDRNYIKFASTFDCIDTFTGDYYGPGTIIAGSGSYPFAFVRSSWIDGKLKPLPREVKRVISINCRTQKTSTTPKLALQGNVTFPVFKMEEIENMMLANHLFVDDTEYQSEGGTFFEQFGKPYNCQYRYKMLIPMQKCFQWQIFGCVPNCDDLATYYAFPKAAARYYDDARRLIATNTDELEIYFESQPGYISVQQLPFVVPFPINALFKVRSTGALTKVIYTDNPIPVNAVFAVQLPVNTLDFTPLSGGVTNNNQVPVPDVVGYEAQTVNVPVPDITGYESIDANKYILSLTAAGGWTLGGGYTSAEQYDGVVTLNISAETNTYQNPIINQPIAYINGPGIPQQTINIYASNNPNLPAGSMLTIDTSGKIIFSGNGIASGPSVKVEFFMVKYNING